MLISIWRKVCEGLPARELEPTAAVGSSYYGTNLPALLPRPDEAERHRQYMKSEVRIDLVEAGADRSEQLRQATGTDDDRTLWAWPFRKDAPHDAVDRVGVAEHHACSDAIFRAAADDV